MLFTGMFAIAYISSFSQASAPAEPEKSNSFEIMAKGGVHSTWLFNKNISNTGKQMDYANAWSFNYGLG